MVDQGSGGEIVKGNRPVLVIKDDTAGRRAFLSPPGGEDTREWVITPEISAICHGPTCAKVITDYSPSGYFCSERCHDRWNCSLSPQQDPDYREILGIALQEALDQSGMGVESLAEWNRMMDAAVNAFDETMRQAGYQ